MNSSLLHLERHLWSEHPTCRKVGYTTFCTGASKLATFCAFWLHLLTTKCRSRTRKKYFSDCGPYNSAREGPLRPTAKPGLGHMTEIVQLQSNWSRILTCARRVCVCVCVVSFFRRRSPGTFIICPTGRRVWAPWLFSRRRSPGHCSCCRPSKVNAWSPSTRRSEDGGRSVGSQSQRQRHSHRRLLYVM